MFDINSNDTLGYANMDIFAAAGFATATTLELNATRAADGAPMDRYGIGAFRGWATGPGRIRAEVSIPGPHSLRLLDPAGRQLAGRTGTGPSESEFSGLRPGLYLLRLQVGTETWVRRAMVPR